MKTVEFDFDIFDGQARVSASLGGMEEFDFFDVDDPCEIKVDYAESIEYLDAREEVLFELRTMQEEFLSAIRDAEKALVTERTKREGLYDEGC